MSENLREKYLKISSLLKEVQKHTEVLYRRLKRGDYDDRDDKYSFEKIVNDLQGIVDWCDQK